MNFTRNSPNVATHAGCCFQDETDDFLIQRWPSNSLASFARDFQTGQRPFFDQGPLKLGDGHQHAELKLRKRGGTSNRSTIMMIAPT